MAATIILGQSKSGNYIPFLLGEDGSLVSEPPTTPWNYVAATGGITNTAAVTLAAAAGAGLVNYLTGISIHNKSSTASEYVITDSVSGSTLFLGYTPATMAAPQVITFPTPLVSGGNSALQFAMSTTSTATYVNATGYVDAASNILVSNEQGLNNLFDDYGNTILDDSSNTILWQ